MFDICQLPHAKSSFKLNFSTKIISTQIIYSPFDHNDNDKHSNYVVLLVVALQYNDLCPI